MNETSKRAPLTALQYLLSLRPALPLSVERPPGEFEKDELNPSNGEVRRWLKNHAVIVNGEPLLEKDIVDFPVFSLVFFPKGKRRTTLV